MKMNHPQYDKGWDEGFEAGKESVYINYTNSGFVVKILFQIATLFMKIRNKVIDAFYAII